MSEKADRAGLETLRKALIEGEESGVAGPVDMERIKREAREGADLDQQRQAELERARALIEEGGDQLARGQVVDGDAFFREWDEELDRDAGDGD